MEGRKVGGPNVQGWNVDRRMVGLNTYGAGVSGGKAVKVQKRCERVNVGD